MKTCPDCHLPRFDLADPNWAPRPLCQAHISAQLLVGCRNRELKRIKTELADALAERDALVRSANGLLSAMANDGEEGADVPGCFDRLRAVIDGHWDRKADPAPQEATFVEGSAKPTDVTTRSDHVPRLRETTNYVGPGVPQVRTYEYEPEPNEPEQ
jgi:hypothetical protein